MNPRGNVVVFGGGTGPIATLNLSDHDYEVTVISSVVDDGGSTGRIMEKLDILPPGDLRRIISNSSQNDILSTEMLEQRINYTLPIQSSKLGDLLRFYGDEAYISNVIRLFEESDAGEALDQDLLLDDLYGHPLGNLMLAVLMLGYGNVEGTRKMCEMAETSVNVLPASEDHATFYFMDAHMTKPSNGEHMLDDFDRVAYPIKSCWLEPALKPYHEALTMVEESDAIVISPTSIYANIISIMLIPGFVEKLRDKKIIWVGNLMTEWNQTAYSDRSLHGIGHVELLKKYMGRYPDAVLVPGISVDTHHHIFSKYEEEGASPVLYREKDFTEKGMVYKKKDDIIDETEILHRGKILKVLRHNRERVAHYLNEMIRVLLNS